VNAESLESFGATSYGDETVRAAIARCPDTYCADLVAWRVNLQLKPPAVAML
jgi:hypothetical protein